MESYVLHYGVRYFQPCLIKRRSTARHTQAPWRLNNSGWWRQLPWNEVSTEQRERRNETSSCIVTPWTRYPYVFVNGISVLCYSSAEENCTSVTLWCTVNIHNCIHVPVHKIPWSCNNYSSDEEMAILGGKGMFNIVFASLAINFYLGPAYLYFSIQYFSNIFRWPPL
jgi:hypothetical protein